MLGDVGQRLLRDAIERRFDFRRQRSSSRPEVCSSRGDVRRASTSPGRSWPAPRGGRGRRAQSAAAPRPGDRRPDPGVRRPARGRRPRGADPCVAVTTLLERADPQAERGQLLAELIVHLARDAAALVLLGEDESCQQLGARALGSPHASARSDRNACRRCGRPVRRARGAPESRATARGRSGRPCAAAGIRPRRFVAPRATLSFSSLGARAVVGMQQPLPGADVRLDLVVGVAEHLLPPRRVDDGAGLEVPVPDAFLGAGERQRAAAPRFRAAPPPRACAR